VQFDLRLILGIAVAFPDIGVPLRGDFSAPAFMSILADTDIQVSSGLKPSNGFPAAEPNRALALHCLLMSRTIASRFFSRRAMVT
jgi:hypothetical protein